MEIRAFGSSIRKQYVTCYYCEKDFIWLNVYQKGSRDEGDLDVGVYVAKCRKCRLALQR